LQRVAYSTNILVIYLLKQNIALFYWLDWRWLPSVRGSSEHHSFSFFPANAAVFWYSHSFFHWYCSLRHCQFGMCSWFNFHTYSCRSE